MKIEPGLFYKVRTVKEFREVKANLEMYGLELIDVVLGEMSPNDVDQQFKKVEHIINNRMQLALIGQHSEYVDSFVVITDLSAICHHECKLNPNITLVDYLKTPYFGPPTQNSLPNI